MSQQKKLERVLDLLLSEDSDQAAELLHQVIVEKARVIYESIVDEEDSAEDDAADDVVGGEPNKDFTDAISSDQKKYLQSYIGELEEVLLSSSFNHPTNGYSKYIDEQSFIEHSKA